MGLCEREDTLSQRDFRRVNISGFVGQTSLEALCASFERDTIAGKEHIRVAFNWKGGIMTNHLSPAPSSTP